MYRLSCSALQIGPHLALERGQRVDVLQDEALERRARGGARHAGDERGGARHHGGGGAGAADARVAVRRAVAEAGGWGPGGDHVSAWCCHVYSPVYIERGQGRLRGLVGLSE